MRIYLPATLDEIDAADPADSAPRLIAAASARRAHAVTAALRAALPDEDDEGLEFAAQLAAADDSLLLIAARPSAPHLRLVLAVDVPDAAVAPVEDDEAAPSAVEVGVPVATDDVVSAHVDEVDALTDVARAMTGDEHAVDRLAERHLLWYDASELSSIPR